MGLMGGEGRQGDLLEDRYKGRVFVPTFSFVSTVSQCQGCDMGMRQRRHCYKGPCKEEDEKEKDKWQGEDLNMNFQVRSSSPCIHSH